VRAMYLSAFVVAVSTWGAISSARPLPLPCLPSHYFVALCTLCAKNHKIF